MTDYLFKETMSIKEKLILLLEKQNERLQIENALLKNSSCRKATRKKRMKPKERRKVRHLKLIAVNGVPVKSK
ncbi:MAG: hypothetical protein IIA63_02960 [Nitrospinae bacterium]|nr:hypothetical protein [Nitrospinota bacterium]